MSALFDAFLERVAADCVNASGTVGAHPYPAPGDYAHPLRELARLLRDHADDLLATAIVCPADAEDVSQKFGAIAAAVVEARDAYAAVVAGDVRR